MGSTTLVSVAEYLRNSYRPDCDYLEGEVRERNMGERPHAKLQSFLILVFAAQEDAWGVIALPEQRVQVSPTRFRIPDICVVRESDPDTPIVSVAPLLCIEILSSDDSLSSMQERVNDYAAMGVQHIWVLDPWKRVAYQAGITGYSPEGETLAVSGTPISVSVPEIFARLDRK